MRSQKIALVSDIHGNWPALDKVLEEIERQDVDYIFCLGDTVGYGPFPFECLMRMVFCNALLRGNHEECVTSFDKLKDYINPIARAAIEHSRSQLKGHDNYLKLMSELTDKKIIPELDITLAHGAYSEPSAWKYIEEVPALEKELEVTPTRLCFIGHTHRPLVFGSKEGLREPPLENIVLPADEKFIINVGSVGQPRDGDCRACYGILDLKENGETTFSIRRVFYDIERTANAIIEKGLPIELAERLFRGE